MLAAVAAGMPWPCTIFSEASLSQIQIGMSRLYVQAVYKIFCFVAQVLVQREEDAPDAAGIVVGTAEVELSLLHVMGQVSGWYNILNARCGPAHMVYHHVASSDARSHCPPSDASSHRPT